MRSQFGRIFVSFKTFLKIILHSVVYLINFSQSVQQKLWMSVLINICDFLIHTMEKYCWIVSDYLLKLTIKIPIKTAVNTPRAFLPPPEDQVIYTCPSWVLWPPQNSIDCPRIFCGDNMWLHMSEGSRIQLAKYLLLQRECVFFWVWKLPQLFCYLI